MQHLNEYLLGKNKKNAISYDIHKDYCILAMYSVDKNIADEIKNEFKDSWMPNNANSHSLDYYLVLVEDAKEYINCSGIVLYKIPDFCRSIEDVQSAAEDGRIDDDELEVLYVCLESKKPMYEFLLSKTNKNTEAKLEIGMHLDQLIQYLEEHDYEDTTDNAKYYALKKEFKVFSKNISIKRLGVIEDTNTFEVFFDKDKCITSCRLYIVRTGSSLGSDIEGLKKYIENKQYK